MNEWRDYFIEKIRCGLREHWQTMYRRAFYRGGPVLMSTIAGIDQALGISRGGIIMLLFMRCWGERS